MNDIRTERAAPHRPPDGAVRRAGPACPLRARYSLAAVVAGWACTVPVLPADRTVTELARHCLDGPGMPRYVLLLAVSGLALSAIGTLWGLVQLFVAMRRRGPRPGPGHPVLWLVMPVAALGLAVQVVAERTASDEFGPQRSPCAGAPWPAGHQ
ncbi:hypothetical protein [Streptomyces sp. TLI_171]|uniref:hypothetical protein n=1 Tax=Streptomyces sp. TLI_171 TaxID=1938859 RepID=UPI000C19EF25|nr:hypothetical protein [Streptomyces sp. TLI_171]RKE18408.1 hypothetical protein BX266_1698 [Streptomyces sp. TLI_171]